MSNEDLCKLVEEAENIMAGEPVDGYTFDPANLGIELAELDRMRKGA